MRAGSFNHPPTRLAWVAFAASLLTADAFAAAITLTPSKDNTLYENATGNLSNGAGSYLFTGRTRNFGIRRAVLAFDLSSIPNDAVITDVDLSVFVDKSASFAPVNVTLLRLTADWGEGASRANSPEGAGGTAQPGDATWIHRFSTATRWTTAGGDFISQASATTSMDGENKTFTWSSTGMVDDVQNWVLNPSTNFGWIVRGVEGTTMTAVRFGSRTNPAEAQRPHLTIQYVPEPAVLSYGIFALLFFRRCWRRCMTS